MVCNKYESCGSFNNVEEPEGNIVFTVRLTNPDLFSAHTKSGKTFSFGHDLKRES